MYLTYTEDWEKYANLETTSLGILQENGKRWVDLSQIYVRSATDKEVNVCTNKKGIFLAGEVVNVPGKWKIPTMEQASMSGKQAGHEVFKYCDIDTSVNMNFVTLESTTVFKLMEGVLAGLTGIAKIIPRNKN